MKIRNLGWLLIGGVFFAVIIYAGILIYLAWPIAEFSISNSGVFGDSFGMLTSLFSGLAFAGLIITIVMQRDELSLQRQELHLTREELSGQRQEMQSQNETLKIQRFENTFFKMLDFLDSCRNDIRCYGSNGKYFDGRDAIRFMYGSFVDGYVCYWVQDSGFNQVRVFKENCKYKDGISEEYARFYDKYGEELGQYYRTLYSILKLVDQADFIAEKNIYTNLVRDQLSRYELLLLFYNCLSGFGNDKMAPLVKKFNLLKHLESKMLPEGNKETWEAFNA